MNKKVIIAVAALLVVGGGAGAYFFLAGDSPKEGPRAKVGYIEPPEDGVTVTDPVSKTTCKKTFSTRSAVYEQKTYYFCCAHCPSAFVVDAAKYSDPI
ncbi:MAG: hypothetical protein VYC39_05155 [Myxococcota bacterium]|nr:hypothetical protein [Myxococcota bacterium]